MQVAGFHRACPSTTLDENIFFLIVITIVWNCYSSVNGGNVSYQSGFWGFLRKRLPDRHEKRGEQLICNPLFVFSLSPF